MKTMPLTPPELTEVPSASVGGTEGVRRTTGGPPTDAGGWALASVSTPDPEVPGNKPRRRFTGRYKLRILQQADACIEAGQLGALLRREGLYSSNLNLWRRQREQGLLSAMEPRKRGRRPKEKNLLAQRVAQLERENQRLQGKLRKAVNIIEVQKKNSEMLGIAQNLEDSEGSN